MRGRIVEWECVVMRDLLIWNTLQHGDGYDV